MQTPRTLLERVGVRTPFARDAVLAAVLAVAGVAVIVAGVVGGEGQGPGLSPRSQRMWLTVPAIVGGAAAVAWRRTAPAAVVAATVAGHLTQTLLVPDLDVGWPGVWVALYSAGAFAPRRHAVAGWAMACLAYACGAAIVPGGSWYPALRGAANDALILGAVTLLGAYVQTRRAYQAELVARANRLERERRERSAAAVLDERGRIARERHDVVAHHLSGMVVQLGAAERLIDRDPQRARALLADIRASGKDTLAGMRRLIGILRASDADGATRPPGVDRLDVVADRARAAGVPVEVTVEGAVRQLPDEVDLAASRILQEALTNVRKHAPGAIARALVRYGPHDIEIRVSDDGPAAARLEPEPSGGVGLVGIHERVSMLGGDVSAGPRTEGGWLVRARLPMARPAMRSTEPATGRHDAQEDGP